MKSLNIVAILLIGSIMIWPAFADPQAKGAHPPEVIFFGLGATAPQTPEQFEEAARKYVADKKVSFGLKEASIQLVVHVSNTNTPVAVVFWQDLHYLSVDFDRDGKVSKHTQGIKYLR